MISSRHSEQASKTAATRLLVVLLAWSQLSLAAHQFEHSLDEAAESCAVCLVFERHDDALPVDDCRTSVTTVSPTVSIRVQTAFRAGAFTPYLSRASP